MRLLTLLVSLLAIVMAAPLTAAQQPPPPPPPPPDPEWARTEGPSWGSYTCPDGSVVFMARLAGQEGLVYTDATGEVAVRNADGLWTGGGLTATRGGDQTLDVTSGGEAVGGGTCQSDRAATVRDRIDGLDGLWIADTRMNPKPERIGLYVPDGYTRGEYRQTLFVGGDRIAIRLEDIEGSQAFPGATEDSFDVGMKLTTDRAEALRALRTEHSGQPTVLLADGVLIGQVQVLGDLMEDRVIAVSGLDDARLRTLIDALQAD